MKPTKKLIISQTRDNGDTVILSLKGDLDIQTAPQLRNFIEKFLEDGNSNIKLDLSKLSYLDSSGYGALLDASRLTGITRSKIDFTNMPACITEFFDISALEI